MIIMIASVQYKSREMKEANIIHDIHCTRHLKIIECVQALRLNSQCTSTGLSLYCMYVCVCVVCVCHVPIGHAQPQ